MKGRYTTASGQIITAIPSKSFVYSKNKKD